MQNGHEEGYQLATLVVIVITMLVLIAFLLIFINPQIALNPLKPPKPTAATTVIVAALPPTWTPVPTDTATPTATPTPTTTPTLTPSPTSTPTNTAIATARPPTRAAPIVPPTPIPLPYSFHPVLQNCTHSGSTQIKGKVSSGGQPVDGVRVILATSPDPATIQEDQPVRRDVDGSTIYAFVMSAIGPLPSFNWYVWVVDATGHPLSDPNYRVPMNDYPASNPLACWLAVVDFVR